MSKSESDVLKGISIICVVFIHLLAIFKPETWLGATSLAKTIITIDQLGRVCIPLFILISWYGLTKKYRDKTPQLFPYIWERAIKLLPLYGLWSVVLYVLLPLVPSWEFAPELPLLHKLLLGQADYHFYFVPLIFMLYILYPFFLAIPARFTQVATMVLLGMQVTWFWGLELVLPGTKIFNLQPDQWQYLIPLSWIWYGWLGIVVARLKSDRKLFSMPVLSLLVVTAVATFLLLLGRTEAYLAETRDILGALKFTRWPVLLYASSMSLLLMAIVSRLPSKVAVGLGKIGSLSFLIYLAHPMLIRLVTYPFHDAFIFSSWLVGVGVTAGLVMVSWWLMKFQ